MHTQDSTTHVLCRGSWFLIIYYYSLVATENNPHEAIPLIRQNDAIKMHIYVDE